MENQFEIFDARIKHPFRMIVAGPSMSGKTVFVTELIKNAFQLIDSQINNIVWFYGIRTKILENILTYETYKTKISLIEGFPDSIEKYIQSNANNLFIFDDLMLESVSNKDLTEIFTRKSHHLNISIILIMQDIFYKGTERKTFLRNSQYLVLFSNPLDLSSIYCIATKIMPKRVNIFMEIFFEATKSAHGYLFIDGAQKTPNRARLKTNIFSPYQTVFISKK